MILIYCLFSLCLQFYFVQNTEAQRRFFGGHEVSPEVLKYLVKVILYDPKFKDSMTICSGSIINQHWVITAAHCLENATRGYEVQVHVQHFQHGRYTTIAEVGSDNCYVHEKYASTQETVKYDVALITTNSPITFSSEVHAIRFGEAPKIGVGTAAGFGYWEKEEDEPREGEVIFYHCFDSLICSPAQQVGITYTGSGDSGGPLIYENRLIGIVSGAICKDIKCPEIYASIAYNINWIISTIEHSIIKNIL